MLLGSATRVDKWIGHPQHLGHRELLGPFPNLAHKREQMNRPALRARRKTV